MQYEGGVFNEQEHSNISFYLPSTVDRNKINKYLSSVHLKPFSVDPSVFGENFNPVNITDRSAIISYMSKVAVQSSQNLKRNADAFLSTITYDNDKILWPGGKRAQADKFALTYYMKLYFKLFKCTKKWTKKIVFHGCFKKNKDGTNRIIGRAEKCLTQTNCPFWKYPEDINVSVRTPSQEKKQKTWQKETSRNTLKKKIFKDG